MLSASWPALSRRSFLKMTSRTLLSLGLGSLFPGQWRKALAGEGLDAFFVRQIVAEDSRTSRMIAWESAVSEDQAVVDLRPAGAEDFSSFAAREKILEDGGERLFSHEAFLGFLCARRAMARSRH